MANTIKKQVSTIADTNEESAFLTELVEGFSRWNGVNEDYAKAYKHMLCAFTQPKKEKTD